MIICRKLQRSSLRLLILTNNYFLADLRKYKIFIMNYKTKSILFWILSFVLMAESAYYQRSSEPTYPERGTVEVNGEAIRYNLIRTWEGETNAQITVEVENREITRKFRFKRFKSFDKCTEKPLERIGEELVASIPGQPAAGKVE